MKTKGMVFVPHWVESVMKRNRVALAGVSDYTKVRGLMSTDDLSAFLSLQTADKISIFKTAYNGHLRSSWGQTRNEGEKAELDSVVVPQSHSKEVVDDAWSRLCKDPNNGEAVRERCWDIQNYSNEAFALVMYPGFVEEMQIPVKQLELVRAILDVFYGCLEQHEVSALPIFRVYVGLLGTAG